MQNVWKKFFPEDPIPLYLDKKSETLKILQRVRDEAHRFGVKHHRTRRTNNTIKSELEEIPGVGEKTIELLLKKLKSVKRVKEANLETLEEILGKQKGKIVWEFLINKRFIYKPQKTQKKCLKISLSKVKKVFTNHFFFTFG